MSERLPRVAIFTPDFPPAHGGIQHLVYRLAQHFRKVEPMVVTTDQAGAAQFDGAQPFRVRRARKRSGRTETVATLNAEAVRSALRFRPDVILNAHIVTSPAAITLNRLTGVPVVQYLHAAEVGARPRLAAFAVRNAARSVVVSRHTEQLALAVGAPHERVHRISPGVDIPSEGPGHGVVRQAARPTVLTVARIENRYKGFDVMVRAMPLVRAKVPEVVWVLVGDGPLRSEVEHLAAAHGVDGAARFAGQVSDAERDGWFRRASVFAMPSRLPASRLGGEGFGIVFLEAGAHGLPVVGGNIGGALDAVVDGETGVLVDPLDHVAVATAISQLLREPERAESLGRAGQRRALDFAWPLVAARVEQLLLDVAATCG